MRIIKMAKFSFLVVSMVLLGMAPISLAGPKLLGCSQFSELFSIDVSTGAATFIGDLPSRLATEIEYQASSNTLFAEEYGTFTRLYKIDPATADSLGFVEHPPGALNGLESVGPILYGTFIPSFAAPSTLVMVDTSTGNLTPVGPTGFGPISGLAYNQATGIMYGVTAGPVGGANPLLVTIDLNTGAATPVGPLGLSSPVGSIEFASNGKLYGGTTTGGAFPSESEILVEINTSTGLATLVGDTGFSITGLTSPLLVVVDIKPGSCPNPLNVKSKGVLPVAIVGTADFDVTTVDPDSVELEGVAPVRWKILDATEPPATGEPCFEAGPLYTGDGNQDLVLYFDTQEIVDALGAVNNGDMVTLTLTGSLTSNTAFEGSDVVRIIKKGNK